MIEGMSKGNRVRLSQQGQKLHPRPPQRDRLGTILGFSRDGDCAWVLWDGLKTAVAYHHDFLDVIAPLTRTMAATMRPTRRPGA